MLFRFRNFLRRIRLVGLSRNDVIEAIRRNGYEQTFGYYYILKDGTRIKNMEVLPNKRDVKAACAMGQAALNLGISPFIIAHVVDGILGEVVNLNDNIKLSLDEIADKLEV
jgi:hypothetical protein